MRWSHWRVLETEPHENLWDLSLAWMLPFTDDFLYHSCFQSVVENTTICRSIWLHAHGLFTNYTWGNLWEIIRRLRKAKAKHTEMTNLKIPPSSRQGKVKGTNNSEKDRCLQIAKIKKSLKELFALETGIKGLKRWSLDRIKGRINKWTE